MTTIAERTEPTQQTETLLESLSSICAVFAVALFIMTFVFQNYAIPTGSMEKTLLIGDHVMVDRVTFAPPSKWMPMIHYREIKRGDIIVFIKPAPEPTGEYLTLVKRAIGIPGDRVHLQNGVLYLNGVAQHESQISMPDGNGDPSHSYYPYRDDFPAVPPSSNDQVTAAWANELPQHIQDGDLVVPPGTVFAMGDNRIGSLDGRYWGFVPRENILGRPLFVYWSFVTPSDQGEEQSISERISSMGHTLLHFFDGTRWKRTFHLTR